MKRLTAYLSAALVALVLLINTIPASAASNTSSGLSINPRKNYVLEPGKQVSDKLVVTNLDSNHELMLQLKMIDFTFTDESGTPKLLLADNAPQTTWSLKPFVTLPKDPVIIAPSATASIPITIKIPANQGAGSYYGAIMYRANGGNGGNVALDASGVTLAFLSIPGVVRENMTLQKFGAFMPGPEQVGGKFIFIATNDVPTQMAYALKNDGNVSENPAGSIVVKNMLGKTVFNIKDANPGDTLALIGQTRRFQACFIPTETKVDFNGKPADSKSCKKPTLWPGRYTANLDVFYGQNGNQTHEIVGSASFWYLPLWFLITLAVVILLLIYFIRKLVRKLQGKTPRDTRRLSFRKKRD